MSLRRTALSTLSVLGVVAATVVPATADTRRGAAECAAALDCTVEEIDQLTMAERLEFVQLMESGPAAELGASDRWHNIEGVITFFRDNDLGPAGSWVSYVDAGIVEGIQRGIAISSGRSADTGGNPGSQKWASYLTRLSNGELTDRAAHDRAWSEAEQASTEHGNAVAEAHGQAATDVESRFYQFSEMYRWVLRNRPVAIGLLVTYGPLIHPDLAGAAVPFYDWFTDVREQAPSEKGCAMAYGFADLNPIDGVVGMAGLFLAYVTELFREYQAQA
jgi:hypothetical protein